MDQHFSSEEFKVMLFGDKLASKCECQPIVRRSERDEEDEVPDEYQSYRPSYTKIKLMLPNNENELPLFRLCDKKDDGTKEEIQLDNFSDVTKQMRRMTKHRMIAEVHKLYAMKTNSGSDKPKCGITIKLVAAECTNKGEVINHRCICFG